MMENGLTKGKEVRMVRVKNVNETPAIATKKLSADKLS